MKSLFSQPALSHSRPAMRYLFRPSLVACGAVATFIASMLLLAPVHAATSLPNVGKLALDSIDSTHPSIAQHAGAQVDLAEIDPIDRLPVVADTIFMLGNESGFAGQILSPSSSSLRLYWQGAPPPAVLEYLRQVDILGVHATIETVSAKFSRIEEQAAAQRVVASDVARELGIASVSAHPDGTGITVQMVADEPDTDGKEAVSRIAEIPVENVSYETNVGRLVPTASRPADAAPWKGGARIVFGGVEACSSGFAALSGSAGRLVSAAHCDYSGSMTVRSGGGTTIANGSGVAVLANIDSMSIDPSASPATDPLAYTGAWNSATASTVKNWASNWTGDTVCAGGASTGTHCGTITDDAMAVPGWTGSWYVRASASSGAMNGGGDSGGPVYRSTTGGVQARGIINAGFDATKIACGAHNPDVTPTCYHDMLYTLISVVLNYWGYSLEVG